MTHFDTGNDYGDKSRSQKKRESTALQKMGEELAGLPLSTIKKLSLPADLFEGLTTLHATKTHEAKRRQMQYIGKLMREIDDIEALAKTLEDIRNDKYHDTNALHGIEELRTSLLTGSEMHRQQATEAALAAYPALEKAKLMHLIQGALAEKEHNRPPKLFRELFKYLKKSVEKN